MSARTPGGLFLVDESSRDELMQPVVRPPMAEPQPVPSFSTGRRLNVRLASEYFVTDPFSWLAELDDPVLLLARDPITTPDSLIALLEACAERARPIAIGAPSIGVDVLLLLIVNKLRGTLTCVAFETDLFGLDDLATIAGGSGAIAWPSTVAIDDLPRASRVVVSPTALSIRPR